MINSQIRTAARHRFASHTSKHIKLEFLQYILQKPSWGGYSVADSGFLCVLFKELFMADWDLPPVGEVVDGVHYTVSSLEEVDEQCEEAAARLDLRLRGYVTPSGGAHVFCLSQAVPPSEAGKLYEIMQCDQLYQMFVEKRGCYAVRVTPKAGRVGDFVARYWKSWGTAPALPELEELMKLHDSFLG